MLLIQLKNLRSWWRGRPLPQQSTRHYEGRIINSVIRVIIIVIRVIFLVIRVILIVIRVILIVIRVILIVITLSITLLERSWSPANWSSTWWWRSRCPSWWWSRCAGQRSCASLCRGRARGFLARMGWRRWAKMWWDWQSLWEKPNGQKCVESDDLDENIQMGKDVVRVTTVMRKAKFERSCCWLDAPLHISPALIIF